MADLSIHEEARPSEPSNPSHWKDFQDWVKRSSSFTDWCIAGFTLALVVTSIYQYGVISGQLGVMQKDQRAWVQFQTLPDKPGSDILHVDSGQSLSYPLGIKNIGKIIARNVVAIVYFDIFDANQEPPLERAAPGTYPHGEITAPILFPDGDIKQPIVRPTDIGKPRVTTDSEVNAMREGKAYIGIYGIITYDDVFGVHHWTKFCQWKGTPGSYQTARCVAYNDVDPN